MDVLKVFPLIDLSLNLNLNHLKITLS